MDRTPGRRARGRRAPAALAQDRALLFRPWGFALSSVAQRVHVWHGTQDWQVPVVLGQVLSAMLPDCSAHWVAGEGHVLVLDHAEEICRTLPP